MQLRGGDKPLWVREFPSPVLGEKEYFHPGEGLDGCI